MAARYGWHILGIILIGGLLSGCLHTPGPMSALQFTSTPPRPSRTPLAPPILISPTGTVDSSATPGTAAPQIDVTIPPTPGSVQATELSGGQSEPIGVAYDAALTIDWETHRVDGKLITHYRNQTGVTLHQVVFRIPSAERAGAFALNNCYTASSDDQCELNGSQLTIGLAQALTSGDSRTITMTFAVQVPPMPVGALSKNGYLGYSARQMNLGDWLPAVAPYRDGNWLVPQPWPTVGETSVTESANYDATVTLAPDPNNTSTPDNPEATAQATPSSDRLMIAGPGEMNHSQPDTWTFHLEHARNFALSIAAFTLSQAVSSDGVTIELYTLSHSASLDPAIQQVLHTAQTALSTYDRLFAMPCPYARMTIVEGDFTDGMEFSGIVFVGAGWFTAYDGKPDSWLTLLTAHELAHQWWYSLVGNDQSQNPMLDETFATYSESLYIEQIYPNLREWWWAFRVDLYKPLGSVDSNVYSFSGERPYIDAVYLRGAEMLRAIRQAIGDQAFFGWLRAYAHTQEYRIATPAALWGLFSVTQYASLEPVRKAYLHNPDPLNADPVITPTSANS